MTKQSAGINYFIKMFEYDKTANTTIADVLLQINEPPEKCKKLLFHMGAALDVWYNRVINETSKITTLFESGSIEKSKELIISNDEKWINYLKRLPEEKLKSEITYKTLKGQEYVNTIEDIITQLITHSHYHRGQINLLLRENGFEPVLVDYIFYLRG